MVEVWQLDLCSFQDVKDFAARAAELDRLDGLVNNASILLMDHELQDGHETMVTVNVMSTLLLTLLLLPKLRQTAVKFNATPHVTIVSSLGAFLVCKLYILEIFPTNLVQKAFFPQKHAENIFEELKLGNRFTDRYNATKLIQLIMMRRLAAAVDTSGKGHVIINAVNPGLCSTQLFRRVYFPLNLVFSMLSVIVARTCEMGSRTLMGGIFAGEEMHGKFMSDCREQGCPGMMEGEEGEVLNDRIWGELLLIMEGIEAGVTENL